MKKPADNTLAHLCNTAPDALVAVDEAGLIVWSTFRSNGSSATAARAWSGGPSELIVPDAQVSFTEGVRGCVAGAKGDPANTGGQMAARRSDGGDVAAEICPSEPPPSSVEPAGPPPTYDELVAENERLRERLGQVEPRIAELERLLEEVRRAAKRQSAPFSKGRSKDEPQTPGRKEGDAHGRHGHRAAPVEADRSVDAPLPACCPHCGEGLDFERWAEQFQTELAEVRPVVTRFRVGVGRCRRCRRPRLRRGHQPRPGRLGRHRRP